MATRVVAKAISLAVLIFIEDRCVNAFSPVQPAPKALIAGTLRRTAEINQKLPKLYASTEQDDSAPNQDAQTPKPAAEIEDEEMELLMTSRLKDYRLMRGALQESALYALRGEAPAVSKEGYSIATFAGGCFWGTELAFQRLPGVVSTMVGYTQGDPKYGQPTYSMICSGRTGHAECCQVYYDPSEVSYKDLLKEFFSKIKPTQKNRQGFDIGNQYRTGVYAHTEEQMKEAEEYVESIKGNYFFPIATELKKATIFWPAERYHQQYLERGGRYGLKQSAEKGNKSPIRCYG
uniref:peptide-methionine (S)-S-oxide reductase n=1 Tax=Fibrocapsa japonica TaxID=94617 RepID=A0A7S2XVB0_9STRA